MLIIKIKRNLKIPFYFCILLSCFARQKRRPHVCEVFATLHTKVFASSTSHATLNLSALYTNAYTQGRKCLTVWRRHKLKQNCYQTIYYNIQYSFSVDPRKRNNCSSPLRGDEQGRIVKLYTYSQFNCMLTLFMPLEKKRNKDKIH